MGLAVAVGTLADLRENDAEGYEYIKAEFAKVNQLLASQGLPSHAEPENVEAWDAQMFGYSGLHYARRLAAHLDSSGALPSPGDNNASSDPVLTEYYARPIDKIRYPHLVQHSDADGFYVPVEFGVPIVADSEDQLVGQILGSTQRLYAECWALARAIGIPENLDPDGDEVWDAADWQGQGDGWHRYGVESFTLVRLIWACQESLRSGSSIVFC